MAQERSEIADEHKWNVEALYKDLATWNKEFNDLAGEKKRGV